ncbi:chemotaxis protein CheB [Rhizobacter sp. SG703]|uniref:chemotaxis protein CheB n=1 Tax=Rhizobacter sp. SG703 TaxID=2587140 RepID=UPI00144705B0|nr:chemotaxis protein CheB [Rhizobacter sp. SG703]NKI92535.1 two-component system CheB/CheR fusion protein [Rhizobacter sp. SG703]
MDAIGPDPAEQDAGSALPDGLPQEGYDKLPVIGLGGSAGGIPALTAFFRTVPASPGVAFVVILHLSPEHESTLAELLQRHTSLRVVQVRQSVQIEPDTVYVIPPRKALQMYDGHLQLTEMPAARNGPVAVDLFFRTLADTHGSHAVAVVLSGADSDGAMGIKRIKERGGLAVAQDPDEAEHNGMPRAAIATGMVDWVLPVDEIAPRVLDYIRLESKLRLPPVHGQQPVADARQPDGEAELREVLSFLRTRTGRDFSNYKRATILRRIARRMMVNGVQELGEYLRCLRTLPGEAGALLQDLLISVTNFFRDADCFTALEAHIPLLFRDKAPNDAVRVWVAACATGEEAYSIAMLLAEHARKLETPPPIQIFATDLDEEAIRIAREGIYPLTIAADVPEDRLRTFFTREHRGYRVRRELREMVLFAAHDLLKDSPFSRLHLMSCRNLLIYLNREAQQRVFETARFALLPEGRLFIGASETVEDDSPYFFTLDKKHRIHAPRPVSRVSMPMPSGAGSIARALELQNAARASPMVAGSSFSRDLADVRPLADANGRSISWAELHFKMIEMLAPPSMLVDGQHEIVHLSGSAGRFLQFSGGEPSRNLLRAIHPSLRVELRAALYKAALGEERITVPPLAIDLGGDPVAVRISVQPMNQAAPGMLLVLLESAAAGEALEPAPRPPAPVEADPLSHHLDRELERLKAHLRDTVEQYEASTEELKASNEELQAMNEELRSATEELETSREELQSINEELTTVNHELKGKVDELGHANSDMQNLMDATAIATVFLDRDLRITRYTPSAVELFNLIPTDVGRPLSHLTNHLNYPTLDADARRVLQGLVPIEREVDDSRQKWYLVRMLPYRTVDDRIAGIVLTLVDVTERKHGQAALSASEERLRLVVDSAVEYAIFSMDMERRVTSWNAGAQRLLGFTESEILGQSCDVIFTDEDRAAGVPEREQATALREGRAMDERTHQRKDGERFWASGAMTPMRDATGTVIGAVKVLRDQTAERLTSDALAQGRLELLQALEEKEKARLELEAADAAKDRFLAVLSHELRNPLASISGASETLAAGASKGDAHERAIRILRQQVGSMRDLLDDLLDVSRLRLGRFAMTQRRVALRSVVDAAVETARSEIERRGHELGVSLPARPVMLDADPSRLSQVLSNLLVNAAKYTDDGGRIALTGHTEGAQLVLTVSDNGRGLDAKALESMFDMFWQSGEIETKSAHSMGIGLSLVRSIVQMHGGTVEARSDGPGHGSAFIVRLPLAPTGDELPVDTDDGATTAGDTRPAPQRIVIADDNEDASWSLATLLSAEGHLVKTAVNGVEAMACIVEMVPDVALLDIAMPGLDGYEVARRVRNEEWGRGMLLIAATGWGSEADRQASSASGFDAHLVKPIDVAKLKELIARWRRPA